jgi:hypothetical protein
MNTDDAYFLCFLAARLLGSCDLLTILSSVITALNHHSFLFVSNVFHNVP